MVVAVAVAVAPVCRHTQQTDVRKFAICEIKMQLNNIVKQQTAVNCKPMTLTELQAGTGSIGTCRVEADVPGMRERGTRNSQLTG